MKQSKRKNENENGNGKRKQNNGKITIRAKTIRLCRIPNENPTPPYRRKYCRELRKTVKEPPLHELLKELSRSFYKL